MYNDAVYHSPLRLPLAIPFDENTADHEHDQVMMTTRLVADPAFERSMRPARWINELQLQRFNVVPVRTNLIITLTLLAGILAVFIVFEI